MPPTAGSRYQPAAQQHPPRAGRAWYRKKRFIIPAALVVIAGLAGSLTDPAESTDVEVPTASSSAVPPTATPSSPAAVDVETSEEPTVAPLTEAPRPSTAPPASTSPTTADPTPTTETPAPSVDPYAERFGTFTTISQSGSGDSVIQLPVAEAGLVTASHEGSANFVLKTLDGSNEMDDLLVNAIGEYSGTVTYGLLGGESTFLQITADGNWTIQIDAITAAPPATPQLSGTGDAVFKYDAGAAVAAVTHTGTSNFVLHQADGSWPNLLINEIGSYDGSVPLMAGPSLLLITADGAWTVTTQ